MSILSPHTTTPPRSSTTPHPIPSIFILVPNGYTLVSAAMDPSTGPHCSVSTRYANAIGSVSGFTRVIGGRIARGCFPDAVAPLYGSPARSVSAQ